MFLVIEKIVLYFSTIMGLWLNTEIKTGINNGTIKIRSIILFIFLTSLAFAVLRIFLTKSINKNGSSSKRD